VGEKDPRISQDKKSGMELKRTKGISREPSGFGNGGNEAKEMTGLGKRIPPAQVWEEGKEGCLADDSSSWIASKKGVALGGTECSAGNPGKTQDTFYKRRPRR